MILWLNPFSGLSGDMLLGALLDLGAPLEEIREAVATTGIDGWDLRIEHVDAAGIAATRAVVETTDTASVRPARELLERARLARPQAVADLATTAIRSLAEVEGRLHGQDPDDVHLHELGGLDTIIDTVAVAAAIHALGVTRVYTAPLILGTGIVATQHGMLPAPAPATLALLEGAHVVGSSLRCETVTPTGAALLKALRAVYDPLVPITVIRTGYGAGARRMPDRPNVLQATLGAPIGVVDSLVLLETNVDDVTGEVLGHVLTKVLEAGAVDAWITPAVMKKGRPGQVVHALARPETTPHLEQLLLAETGSLGLRRSLVQRPALHRRMSHIDLRGHPIRIKIGPWGAKPEHDDLTAAAQALQIPLRQAAVEAASAIASQHAAASPSSPVETT